MKVPYAAWALLVLGGIIVWSCQHEIQWPKTNPLPTDTSTVLQPTTPPPPLPPPAIGAGCSPDTVYFSSTILPLLSSNCAMSGCHNGLSSGDAGQYTLNTYSGIRAIVRPGNPGSSKLVDVISNGSMPPRGHTPLTPAQLTLIKTWINQGALNNSCTASGCDTASVTYSGSITAILQTNCYGCHSGSTASAGVNLTNYAGVLAQVQNGKLWGDVSHSTGYNAMPVGGALLSACDLNMINSWIKKGSPNN